MENIWIITAVLGGLVIYILYFFVNKKINYWKNRGVPQIKSSALKMLLLRNKSFNDIVRNDYEQLGLEGTKLAGYFPLFSVTVMARDPELINQILIKDFTYFEDRSPEPIGNDILSQSLAMITGDRWRYLRHKLTPTFSSGKLKMMFDPIKECSEELVEYLKDKTGEDIEAKRLMYKCILNIIGSVAFGMKINAFTEKEEDIEFIKLSDKFFKPSSFVILKFILFSLLPRSIQKILNVKFMDSKVDDFFRSLVRDMIEYRERTGIRRNDFLQLMMDQRNNENGNNSSRPGNSEGKAHVAKESTYDNEEEPGDKELLDQLKSTKNETDINKYSNILTEDCIAAQTFLFISGGSEPTATTISFVLFQLAMHPNLQKRVQQEIDEVLSKQQLNYEAVKKMTYMEQFIHETMRIFTGPALARICTKDYKVPGTDTILEKGTNVQIPLVGLHMDPQYFPDPEKFDPDRFQDMDSVPKGVFFPFGAGPRMCIAMRLALLEIKIILATLLSTYNVVLSKKTKLPLKLQKFSLVLAAEGGLWVQFEKRTDKSIK